MDKGAIIYLKKNTKIDEYTQAVAKYNSTYIRLLLLMLKKIQ